MQVAAHRYPHFRNLLCLSASKVFSVPVALTKQHTAASFICGPALAGLKSERT